MTDGIIKFDDQMVKEKIIGNIRGQFLDLIPQEVFKKLIDNEVDEFIKNEVPKIIGEELRSQCQQALKDEIGKEKYRVEIDQATGQIKAGEEIMKVIAEAAPKMIMAILGSMIKGVAQNISYNISNAASQTGNYNFGQMMQNALNY